MSSIALLLRMGDLNDEFGDGLFINNNAMRCVEVKPSKFKSFMIYARELNITWGHDPRYWRWLRLEEDMNDKVEVAELLKVCWLEVHGSLQMSHLEHGQTYDIMFVIMMKDATGFEPKATFKLELPDGQVDQKNMSLQNLPTKEWVKVKAGDFVAKGEGEIKFSMIDYEKLNWKTGLIIQGVLIQHRT